MTTHPINPTPMPATILRGGRGFTPVRGARLPLSTGLALHYAYTGEGARIEQATVPGSRHDGGLRSIRRWCAFEQAYYRAITPGYDARLPG